MNFGGRFDLDHKLEQIADFEEKMAVPNFWDDNERAQKLIIEMNVIKSVVDEFSEMNGTCGAIRFG